MKYLSIIAAFALLFVIGCSDDDDNNMTGPTASEITLNILGLEDLGTNARYEGWLIVNGTPVTTGKFTVNSSGELSETMFPVNQTDIMNASAFVLTVEPHPDNDPAPSDVHILAGDFSGNNATLTLSHGAALGDDFSNSSGSYILATPTDGSNTNENSGIWFLDPSSGTPMAGLDLPTLPAGWMYEGWVVIDGIPVTTGKFTMADMADDSAPYSSTMAAPPFPGEDFLLNAPGNLTFPTDISGGTAVISVEPEPDNSANPFLLKPLVGGIPDPAMDHTLYLMNLNLSSLPTGTAIRAY
ncbi:hypothetical protein AMJ86_02485 [bacterium SM23_57]|nr:MAG: hypothetical protein AMJ86_02485 [bacterium SM23_57]